MIIRHGEKLGDPGADDDGGSDLSATGSARAAALPNLFMNLNDLSSQNQLPVPSCGSTLGQQNDNYTATYVTNNVNADAPVLPTPTLVYATTASTNSNRPVETVIPFWLRH